MKVFISLENRIRHTVVVGKLGKLGKPSKPSKPTTICWGHSYWASWGALEMRISQVEKAYDTTSHMVHMIKVVKASRRRRNMENNPTGRFWHYPYHIHIISI